MIVPWQKVKPEIHPEAYVEDSACIIGDVKIGADSSVWFNCVIRADVNHVRIGERTNVQDLCMVHVTLDKWPTIIGSDTTVGHHAIIHGAAIGDNCLIGMGAILLDGVEVGDHCLVAAGSLLSPGTKAPTGTLVMGTPAKPVRDLTDRDLEMIKNQGLEYIKLAREYKAAR